MKAFLSALLESRVSRPSWDWFHQVLAEAVPPVSDNRFLTAYNGMSRKLGKHALLLSDDEKRVAQDSGVELPLDHWGADEAGRAVLLLTLAGEITDPDEFERLARECYDTGDSREQGSWLRGLSLLPQPERFLDAATDSCRTNIIPLFEAIACENPYPGAYFPELNFNQMVLKALFNVVPITRVIGLETRLNVELSRMASDYVSEREAAGRPFPHDIWLTIAPRIPEAELGVVYRYLQHDDAQHRYWAARGLGYRTDTAGRQALENQRHQESEAEIIGVMDRSLGSMTGQPERSLR